MSHRGRWWWARWSPTQALIAWSSADPQVGRLRLRYGFEPAQPRRAAVQCGGGRDQPALVWRRGICSRAGHTARGAVTEILRLDGETRRGDARLLQGAWRGARRGCGLRPSPLTRVPRRLWQPDHQRPSLAFAGVRRRHGRRGASARKRGHGNRGDGPRRNCRPRRGADPGPGGRTDPGRGYRGNPEAASARGRVPDPAAGDPVDGGEGWPGARRAQ